MSPTVTRIDWDAANGRASDVQLADLVIFNISGVKFQATLKLLEFYPGTEFARIAAFVRYRNRRRRQRTVVVGADACGVTAAVSVADAAADMHGGNKRIEVKPSSLGNNLSGESLLGPLTGFHDNTSQLKGAASQPRTHDRGDDDNEDVEIFEFYMERSPTCFTAIMDYMRTGKLHHPPNVCCELFRAELQYWKVPEQKLELCCLNDYIRSLQNGRTLRYFSSYLRRMAARASYIDKGAGRFCYWRQMVWKVMMVPTFSRAALIYSTITSLLILVNVVVIMIQTDLLIKAMPLDHDGSARHSHLPNRSNSTGGCPYNHGTIIRDGLTAVLFRIDMAFTVLFSFEIAVRFLVAPSLKLILTNLSNWIEMISLFPYFYVIKAVIEHNFSDECLDIDMRAMRILFMIRIIRVYRIFFTISYCKTFIGFIYTLRSSLREFLILFSLVGMVTVISGSLISLLEGALENDDDKTKFENWTDGMWWALVSLTTVGYGDMVPQTTPGRLLTAVVSLSGITVIALATPMVSYNFNVIYTFMLGSALFDRKVSDEDEDELVDDERVTADTETSNGQTSHHRTLDNAEIRSLPPNSDSNNVKPFLITEREADSVISHRPRATGLRNFSSDDGKSRYSDDLNLEVHF